MLATGTDVIHPVGNAELLRTIAENHLILSELAPGRHATRTQFLARTRILAALSAGTVIKPESDPGPCASPNKHENSDESWAPSPEP